MAANDVPCCEPMFWVYFIICVLLVLFAGLMSGLTLGLMSLSLVDLEVLAKAGKPEDKKNAGLITSLLLVLVSVNYLLLFFCIHTYMLACSCFDGGFLEFARLCLHGFLYG